MSFFNFLSPITIIILLGICFFLGFLIVLFYKNSNTTYNGEYDGGATRRKSIRTSKFSFSGLFLGLNVLKDEFERLREDNNNIHKELKEIIMKINERIDRIDQNIISIKQNKESADFYSTIKIDLKNEVWPGLKQILNNLNSILPYYISKQTKNNISDTSTHKQSDKIQKSDKKNQTTNGAISSIPPTDLSRSTIKFSERELIDWWTQNADIQFNECKQSLIKTFNIQLEIHSVLSTKYMDEDWLILAIRIPNTKHFYLIPRKNTVWVEDYFSDWFNCERNETPSTRSEKIISVSSLPEVISINNLLQLVNNTKGKVTIE